MTFFVDANVILYAATECEQQEACNSVIEAIADGADGRTSPAVLEEVWHLARSGRMGSIEGVVADAHLVFTPLLPVTDEAFARALAVEANGLGTADRLHVGTCLVHGIETIVTADRDFDGVPGLRRVDPLDARARARLLRAAG